LLQSSGFVLLLLAQAPPFRFHCGLHRLQAGVQGQMESAWASTKTTVGRGTIS
jgi:hypothetical protein